MNQTWDYLEASVHTASPAPRLPPQVSTHGPITISFDSEQPDFYFYASGVYDNPACRETELSHTVVLAGYGTDKVCGVACTWAPGLRIRVPTEASKNGEFGKRRVKEGRCAKNQHAHDGPRAQNLLLPTPTRVVDPLASLTLHGLFWRT